MEHLRHYQRHPGWDKVDGDQPISPQPQGHAPLPHQVTEDTQSDSWGPQYAEVQGSANLISPSIQTNEQFTPQQNPQHGTQISGYGPAYPHSQPQDQHLSPLPPYGSNYNPGNYGIQGGGLPCRPPPRLNHQTGPPPHPNHQTGPQRTLSTSTAPTNFTRHSYGSAGSGLNQSYKYMRSAYFIPGTVFACLWTEPLGGTTTYNPKPSARISEVCFGQFAYSNILRFVVILTPLGEQFSLCCPIKTYGHKGTAKNQNAHHNHSMIYATGMQPQQIRGEADFNKKAIEMRPADNRYILDPESRLNFAKPTPVEHNLRVKHLGRIIPEHIHRLFRSYREVNGTSAIQRAEETAMKIPRAEETAMKAARRLEAGPRNFQSDLLDDEEDDSDDNEDDDEVSLKGRYRRRGRDDDEEPEYDHGSEIRRAGGRRPSASSRYTRAEHPHVESSSYTQPHRGRSNTGLTSRSSPVPFGSPRPIGKSPRRMTQGQIEAPPPDSRLRKYSKDPNRRDDGRYGSYG